MYPILVNICAVSLFIYGSTKADDNNCVLSRKILEHALVAMDIVKSGFHRELVTTVEVGPEAPNGLGVLLSHSLPSGVYMDPYQLASLKEDSGLQVLLNSSIDVEAPAHMSPGVTALVFLPLVGGRLTFTIPVHGRYHRPSHTGEEFEIVKIEMPKLMLKVDTCTQVHLPPAFNIVDAPCTAANISLCHWLEIHKQEQSHVTLKMALGDESLVSPVWAGTLLVTLLCCGVLSRRIQKTGPLFYV